MNLKLPIPEYEPQRIDPRQYGADIKHLLGGYADETPGSIVNSKTGKDPHYKARNVWFGNIGILVFMGLLDGSLGERTQMEYDSFVARIAKPDFYARVKTPEDISAGNSLLMTAIAELELTESGGPSMHSTIPEHLDIFRSAPGV